MESPTVNLTNVKHYEKKTGNRIIFIREKCHFCSHMSKREHIFTQRVHNFCFFWTDVSWYNGFISIAVMTIIFGIFQFVFIHGMVLRTKPSGIHSYSIFPGFVIISYIVLLFYSILGIKLWRSIYTGNLRTIKNFPWALLLGYILSLTQLISILFQVKSVAEALTMSDHQMHLDDTELEKANEVLHVIFVLYGVFSVYFVVSVAFISYLIILSLSWIDTLKLSLGNDED